MKAMLGSWRDYLRYEVCLLKYFSRTACNDGNPFHCFSFDPVCSIWGYFIHPAGEPSRGTVYSLFLNVRSNILNRASIRNFMCRRILSFHSIKWSFQGYPEQAISKGQDRKWLHLCPCISGTKVKHSSPLQTASEHLGELLPMCTLKWLWFLPSISCQIYRYLLLSCCKGKMRVV